VRSGADILGIARQCLDRREGQVVEEIIFEEAGARVGFCACEFGKAREDLFFVSICLSMLK